MFIQKAWARVSGAHGHTAQLRNQRARKLSRAVGAVVQKLERRMLLSAVALPSFVHPSEYAVYGANDDGTAGDPVTLDVMSGDISIDANLASAGGGWANTTINLHADAHVYFNSAQTITGGLTLADYSQVTVAQGSGGSNTNLLDLGALSIDTNAKLDLTDNAMILRNGNSTGESAVQALIERGAGVNTNDNGWDWSGTGITSSVAAADPNLMTGIGYALNDGYDTTDGSPLSTFCGVSVGATDVLARYTFYGDTDLSGTVENSDYANIDANQHHTPSDWAHGDFDYSGTTDSVDYFYIDSNVGRSLLSPAYTRAFQPTGIVLSVTEGSSISAQIASFSDTLNPVSPPALTARSWTGATATSRLRR